MVARQDANSSRKERKDVRELIEKRMEEVHRLELKSDGLPYACQEAILEEVLRRANRSLDSASLLALVDSCIRESRTYQKLSTDRGLKSFYRLRIKVLRSAILRIRKFVNPRRWLRKRKRT